MTPGPGALPHFFVEALTLIDRPRKSMPIRVKVSSLPFVVVIRCSDSAQLAAVTSETGSCGSRTISASGDSDQLSQGAECERRHYFFNDFVEADADVELVRRVRAYLELSRVRAARTVPGRGIVEERDRAARLPQGMFCRHRVSVKRGRACIEYNAGIEGGHYPLTASAHLSIPDFEQPPYSSRQSLLR